MNTVPSSHLQVMFGLKDNVSIPVHLVNHRAQHTLHPRATFVFIVLVVITKRTQRREVQENL